MNCRQSELQKGILFHCFPSRRSGNPITSFPGNFQSRAKCCQTEKESICLPSHVSMQCKSRGENSKNWRKNWSWFVCCIIFRATKWEGGGGRVPIKWQNYLPYHVQIKNVKCFNFCLGSRGLPRTQNKNNGQRAPLKLRLWIPRSTVSPPSPTTPYIGLCKFICGDFALAPN